MGAAASSLAGPASVASLGLTVAGDLAKGSATQASDEFQASRLEQAAAFGKTQAALTDSTMRENLNITLGNIETVRAAAGIDPTSPTTGALMGQSTDRANMQRMAAVGTIRSQNAEDIASANYLRQAGDFAVTQSYLSAGKDVFSAVGKAAMAGA